MSLYKSNINCINNILSNTQSIENKADDIFDEVEIIETHNHSNERWFEKAAVANGELHVADRIGEGSGSFQIDGGNNNWGAWIQVLGTLDTPTETGKRFFDGHRAEFVSAERNADYFIQVIPQNTNPNTGGIEDETRITEFVLRPLSVAFDSGPVEIKIVRVPVGTKIWVRTMCDGQDTGTLNFYFGIHEYDE